MATRVLRPQFEPTPEIVQKLVARSVRNESGCLEWTGPKDGCGYGTTFFQKHTYGAHILAWRCANGGKPVPIGYVVMHSCNNPSCIEPSHLSIGTQADNMQHASKCGALSGVHRQRGSKRYNAILNEDIVLQIRLKHRDGAALRVLAEKFAVPLHCVRSVVTNKAWLHVQIPDAAEKHLQPTGGAR